MNIWMLALTAGVAYLFLKKKAPKAVYAPDGNLVMAQPGTSGAIYDANAAAPWLTDQQNANAASIAANANNLVQVDPKAQALTPSDNLVMADRGAQAAYDPNMAPSWETPVTPVAGYGNYGGKYVRTRRNR